MSYLAVHPFVTLFTDKVCSTNDDEHCNVESSLILFIKYA